MCVPLYTSVHAMVGEGSLALTAVVLTLLFDLPYVFFPFVFKLQEEVKEGASALSVHGHNIKVTEVLKDEDTLTFLIVSQKVRKRPVDFIGITTTTPAGCRFNGLTSAVQRATAQSVRSVAAVWDRGVPCGPDL